MLVTENLEEAKRLIQDYPWLQEIYEEIAMLRHRPEEVLGMFSEALRMLDHNTVKYMIEELQKQLEDEKAAAIREKAAVIKEKDAEREVAIKEKDAEKEAAIKEKAAVIMEKDAEIAELKKQLEAVRPG